MAVPEEKQSDKNLPCNLIWTGWYNIVKRQIVYFAGLITKFMFCSGTDWTVKLFLCEELAILVEQRFVHNELKQNIEFLC